MKLFNLSVLMSALVSLGQSVFARGFESESIVKLTPVHVSQIGTHLIKSGKAKILLMSQQAPQGFTLGKISVEGLNYDLQSNLESLTLDSGQLLASFDGIDSVIRISTLTYNDVINVDAGGIIGSFRVSFQCKDISLRLTANETALNLVDISTASLNYTNLQVTNFKMGACSGLSDAAQMVAQAQQELAKQLQDPDFFNQVYKPQIMPILVNTIMNSRFESKVGEKIIQVQARDMKIENGYLLLASDIHIPDPKNLEIRDYRVNQVQEGINVSKPFIFSLFNEVAFKGQRILSIPSHQIPGLDKIRNSWFMQLFVLPELLSYPTGIPLHVEIQQVSDLQFYVALMGQTKKGPVRILAAYINMHIDLDGFANDERNFLRGVQIVRGSSRLDFFTEYFIDYVNEQMNAYRSSIFDSLQIPGLKDFGIRINLVD